MLTIQVTIQVDATCDGLANFTRSLIEKLANQTNVTSSAITVRVPGCSDVVGRRLLQLKVLTIVIATTAGDAKVNSAISQQVLRGSALAELATSNNLVFLSVEVSPTETTVSGCATAFGSFSIACGCAVNITGVSQCPVLCAQYGKPSCRDSVSSLSNCSTDSQFGVIIKAVRDLVSGKCGTVVSGAPQATLAASFILAALLFG